MSQSTIRKNHMDVLWHEYTDNNGENIPVTQEPVHGVYEVL